MWNAEHLLRKLEIAGVNRSVDCGNEMALGGFNTTVQKILQL